jgi:D-alanyl-D-alanine carboxypeptidase
MALNDILNAAFGQEEQSNRRQQYGPSVDPSVQQIAPAPTVGMQSMRPPSEGPNLASLLPLLLGGKQGGGSMGGSGVPGNIDPSLDLMTRHGVTLDEDAIQSLIQARRAGFNAFPYIGSDYRSVAEQARMYADRANNSLPVAPPGQSLHNQGLAFDAGGLPTDVRRYLLNNGWFWGNSFGDPVHYSFGQSG